MTLDHWEGKITRQIIEEHRRIAVATSGGVDSMVLLHKLAKLRVHDLASGSKDWELLVVHVDFGLRGNDSEADAAFVRASASELGLPIHYHKAQSLSRKAGVQEWARETRYNIFYSLAKQGWVIALAHHSDDLAESILFRMARGTSAAHLAGMSVWHKPFLRPFLGVSKKEIISYAKQENISFREDSSNAETKYSRNKIRHLILPIRNDLFPGAAQRIAQLGLDISQIGFERQDELKKRIMTHLVDPTLLTLKTYISLKEEGFTPNEIVDGYLKINGTNLNLTLVHYKSIVQQIEKSQESKNCLWYLSLPEETVLKWQQNCLSIEKVSSGKGTIPSNEEIQSQNLIGFINYDILVPLSASCSICPSLAWKDSVFIAMPKQLKKRVTQTKKSLFLESSLCNLHIRRPKNSEKLMVFGHPKALTFKDMFMELGIPSPLRHKYFVISQDRKLNWLCDGKYVYEIDLQNKQLIRLNNF